MVRVHEGPPTRTVAGCTSREVQLFLEVLTAFAKGVAAQDLRERVNPTTTHLHFTPFREATPRAHRVTESR